jgi:hypothetical protein
VTHDGNGFSVFMREDAAGFGPYAQEFEDTGFGNDGGEALDIVGRRESSIEGAERGGLFEDVLRRVRLVDIRGQTEALDS